MDQGTPWRVVSVCGAALGCLLCRRFAADAHLRHGGTALGSAYLAGAFTCTAFALTCRIDYGGPEDGACATLYGGGDDGPCPSGNPNCIEGEP